MGLLFTYGLTYGGSLVSLVNPFYGLLIYICFAIIKPPALWPWSVPVGSYSRIIGVSFLVGWTLNGFGDQRVGAAKPVLYALLGYWLWVMLSTTSSPDPSLGAPFCEYLAKIVLPFAAGLTLVRTERQLEMLFWTVLISCAFLAYEANLAYLNGYHFEQLGFLHLDNNSFAILMVTSYGLALVNGFLDSVWWRRYFCFGCAAAMAHVPMLAMSRGGMVGVAVATMAAFFVLPKTGRVLRGFALALIAGSVLAGPSVVDEFSTSFQEEEERDYSAQSRVDLWRDCTEAMLRNPLFGVGQEHWGLVAPSYGWPLGKEAHSLWFQTAAELGIPGLAFLVGFYVIAFLKMRSLAKTTESEFIRAAALGTAVAIVGFAVSGSFVTVEGFELPYYVVLIGLCGLKANESFHHETALADDAIPYEHVYAASAT